MDQLEKNNLILKKLTKMNKTKKLLVELGRTTTKKVIKVAKHPTKIIYTNGVFFLL